MFERQLTSVNLTDYLQKIRRMKRDRSVVIYAIVIERIPERFGIDLLPPPPT